MPQDLLYCGGALGKYKIVKLSPTTHHRLKQMCFKYLPPILEKPRLSFDMCLSLILDDLEESIADQINELKRQKTEEARKELKQIAKEHKPQRYYPPPPPPPPFPIKPQRKRYPLPPPPPPPPP